MNDSIILQVLRDRARDDATLRTHIWGAEQAARAAELAYENVELERRLQELQADNVTHLDAAYLAKIPDMVGDDEKDDETSY